MRIEKLGRLWIAGALAGVVGCFIVARTAPAQRNLIPSSLTELFHRAKGSDSDQDAAVAASTTSSDEAAALDPFAGTAPAVLAPDDYAALPQAPAPAENQATDEPPRPQAALPAPPGELLQLPPVEQVEPLRPIAPRNPTPPLSLPAETAGERVSLVVRDATIGEVLAMIAEQHGLNIVTGDQVDGTVSVSLHNVPLQDALDSILTANGYTWNLHQSVLVVSTLSTETRLSPFAQGRIVRVFDLNFVSSVDVNRVVTGLLSPVGQSFYAETSPTDQRRTREQLVIEDMPAYVARVEDYLIQADRPPMQVLIEAHILEVQLEDDTVSGVDLDALLRVANSRITWDSVGFADPGADPSFFIGIDGTDLDGLIQLLKTTTDAKTLASPKVLAVNGQEARIQIGGQLGYFVTTTTQTSTLQNVDFLDVGVVLRVTPIISQDGRVLMHVKPEVSNGQVNPITGLPEEDTTEVETTVMLEDGRAMVIGGLIQEELIELENKIPYLGDLYLVGRLFQRRTMTRERTEIIVALVPRIVPYDGQYACREEVEVSRATTRLTYGDLQRVDRRAWEPELRDAVRNPIPILKKHK